MDNDSYISVVIIIIIIAAAVNALYSADQLNCYLR
jgi:hypothetical protein